MPAVPLTEKRQSGTIRGNQLSVVIVLYYRKGIPHFIVFVFFHVQRICSGLFLMMFIAPDTTKMPQGYSVNDTKSARLLHSL